MSHREAKKAAKRMNKQHSKPEHIHEDEMKKHETKGLIRGV